MSITSATLAELSLAEIETVVFYKRDEITTDLICCDIDANGRTWTFHEEADGWDKLIAHLQSLPGFRSDWYSTVMKPPFAANEVVAYQRG